MVCVSTIFAPTAVSSGAKGARQAHTVVAALVAGDDVLLLEGAVDADVEGLVPPAVLGNAVSATIEGPVLANAVSATVEGPGVLVFTALAVLDVNGDELPDPARAKVPLGSGVDCAMDPVVLDDVDASTLVLTDVADDDMLLLNARMDGLGVAVLVILEEVDDVNTSVLAHRAPWTRARMWTIQGHEAFENAQGHGGRHCPLLPQAMSIKNKGVLRVGVLLMQDLQE